MTRRSAPYLVSAWVARSALLSLPMLLALPAGAQDSTRVAGQQRRVGLSADRATREVVDGRPLRRLIGNVRLQEDETILRANRATEYERRNEVLFEGNVLIFERGDTLRARSVLYNRATKVGFATGDVRLTDGEVRVTAPSATYYTSEKRTTFDAGVRLVDSVSVLTSLTGIYWSDQKRAEFAGDVRLDGSDTDVRADSLTYLRETEVSVASGNVFVESFELDEDAPGADTTATTVVVGGWAFTDDPGGVRRIREDVLLFQIRRDSTGTDTLLIRSDRLESVETDSLELLSAVGGVRIWTDETAAASDSVAYRTAGGPERREVIELFGGPIAWFGSSQVTGDSLIIKSRGGSPDTLLVRNNTLVADRDSALARIHQVSGRHLVGLFRNGGRRDMIVGPNAEAIYYLRKDDRPDGAVRTSADRIVFELQDDELKRIRVEDGVEGTYYPEDLMPSDLRLAGFRWSPERRPVREAMLSDPRLHRGNEEVAVSGQMPVSEMIPVAPERAALVAEPRPLPVESPRVTETPPRIPPAPRPGDWSPGGIEVARGGFTIVVASRSSIKDALDLARTTSANIASANTVVDVLKGMVSGRFTYRVAVGQYRSRADADRSLRSLDGQIPAESWILAITPDM